ncbi:MAG TPA: UDP-N-acetylglucosamine 2-epimerase (non-hydrolyzing) [Thermoanaerobaculia bacterium]|nr:UDP-N-acetylglucosamine 2-epimerase (non-hydrolyzing) [Thermoanaerobaculia bacterium]
MKIVTVVGARPQFIKAAVVSRAIQERNRQGGAPIEEVLVHTGQHYDDNMSAIFFEQMRIPRPDHHLAVRERTHGAMTGAMLRGIEEILIDAKPDAVLVYGDTNSTLAGALAAAKMHIPIAHVEAGLRSFNMRMPEEINRILTDHVSTWLFCPTETAIRNLDREGLGTDEKKGRRVIHAGDVMYDAALFYRTIAEPAEEIRRFTASSPDFVLATIHREENTSDLTRLGVIMSALEAVAEERPVILPVHPRTRKVMADAGLAFDRVKTIDPVGYFDMIHLLEHARVVMTDSGGVQKEAFFFKSPCVTLRSETEWVELVEAGANFLSGNTKEEILAAYGRALAARPDWSIPLYGAGDGGKRILDALAG